MELAIEFKSIEIKEKYMNDLDKKGYKTSRSSNLCTLWICDLKVVQQLDRVLIIEPNRKQGFLDTIHIKNEYYNYIELHNVEK